MPDFNPGDRVYNLIDTHWQGTVWKVRHNSPPNHLSVQVEYDAMWTRADELGHATKEPMNPTTISSKFSPGDRVRFIRQKLVGTIDAVHLEGPSYTVKWDHGGYGKSTAMEAWIEAAEAQKPVLAPGTPSTHLVAALVENVDTRKPNTQFAVGDCVQNKSTKEIGTAQRFRPYTAANFFLDMFVKWGDGAEGWVESNSYGFAKLEKESEPDDRAAKIVNVSKNLGKNLPELVKVENPEKFPVGTCVEWAHGTGGLGVVQKPGRTRRSWPNTDFFVPVLWGNCEQSWCREDNLVVSTSPAPVTSENPFKIGDLVRWTDSDDSEGNRGTVLEVRVRTTSDLGRNTLVKWEHGHSAKWVDHKRITLIPPQKSAFDTKWEKAASASDFKPGDRVRWHKSSFGMGTVREIQKVETGRNPMVGVYWDTTESSPGYWVHPGEITKIVPIEVVKVEKASKKIPTFSEVLAEPKMLVGKRVKSPGGCFASSECSGERVWITDVSVSAGQVDVNAECLDCVEERYWGAISDSKALEYVDFASQAPVKTPTIQATTVAGTISTDSKPTIADCFKDPKLIIGAEWIEEEECGVNGENFDGVCCTSTISEIVGARKLWNRDTIELDLECLDCDEKHCVDCDASNFGRVDFSVKGNPILLTKVKPSEPQLAKEFEKLLDDAASVLETNSPLKRPIAADDLKLLTDDEAPKFRVGDQVKIDARGRFGHGSAVLNGVVRAVPRSNIGFIIVDHERGHGAGGYYPHELTLMVETKRGLGSFKLGDRVRVVATGIEGVVNAEQNDYGFTKIRHDGGMSGGNYEDHELELVQTRWMKTEPQPSAPTGAYNGPLELVAFAEFLKNHPNLLVALQGLAK